MCKKTVVVPDIWIGISKLGHEVAWAAIDQYVQTERAHYYLKRTFSHQAFKVYYNYEVFDKSFKSTTLSFDGVIGSDTMLFEHNDNAFKDGVRLDFTITDRSNRSLKKSFGGGVEAIRECLLFMEQLSKYGTYEEMELTLKLSQQQEELKDSARTIAELKAKNEELQSKLDSIYESKSDLRKLTQLLYEN